MACLRFASLNIPNAQVLNLATTPKTIVPAPGIGKRIQLIDAFVSLDFTGSAFSNNPNVFIQNAASDVPQAYAGEVINGTADLSRKFVMNNVVASTDDEQIEANSALQVLLSAAPTGGGGSALIVYIYYRIVTE